MKIAWTIGELKCRGRLNASTFNLRAVRSHVYLQHGCGISWPCPQCGKRCKLHDHQPERGWSHLDVFQYQTILHARPPRCRCEDLSALFSRPSRDLSQAVARIVFEDADCFVGITCPSSRGVDVLNVTLFSRAPLSTSAITISASPNLLALTFLMSGPKHAIP